MAIAWSAESLRSDIGAETDRDDHGAYAGPYRLARDLTLLAAASAGVAAIDTVFANPHDKEGLRAEALAARRDGFAGKMAIDAAQAAVINDVFRREYAAAPRRRAGELDLLQRGLARRDLGHPFLGVLPADANHFQVLFPAILHKICAGNHCLRIQSAHH